jgi:hypothetical protein
MVTYGSQNDEMIALLKEISAGLQGLKVLGQGGIRLAYSSVANATTYVTGTSGIFAKFNISTSNYSQRNSLQTDVYEYLFSCNDEIFENMQTFIIQAGYPVYLTTTRLPISSAIGSIAVTATATISPPTSLGGGSTTTTAGTAMALGASTSIKRVHIQSDYSNASEIVLVGGSSPSGKLYAGDWITLEVDNLADAFIQRGSTTNVTVNYIIEVA